MASRRSDSAPRKSTPPHADAPASTVFTKSTSPPPAVWPAGARVRIDRARRSVLPTAAPKRTVPSLESLGPERRTTAEFPAVLPRKLLSEEPPSYQVSPPRAPMASLDLESVFEQKTAPGRELAPLDDHATRARAERAILTVLTGVNAGQVFSLERAETIIGRSREATIQVDDVGISRKHTRIVRADDGRYFVEDLGSTNGTFVAARRVDRFELRAGDRVQVGPNVLFRFSVIDATEEHLARSLYEASTRDALTRAFNRKYFVERLDSEIAYAVRHKTPVSVILFDLDHFKAVNDTHGHLAGDVVLRVVAAAVEKSIRLEDVLARYGGEEFAILVRGIEHEKVAMFAERVRRAVEGLTIQYEKLELKVTISAGAASLAQCGDVATPEALLLLADERLYHAKDQGRNRVTA